MEGGKRFSSSPRDEESESTPSGIQSDTPDRYGLDTTSGTQSLPTTRGGSGTSSTLASITEGKTTITSGSVSRSATRSATSSGATTQGRDSTGVIGEEALSPVSGSWNEGQATELAPTRDNDGTPSQLKTIAEEGGGETEGVAGVTGLGGDEGNVVPCEDNSGREGDKEEGRPDEIKESKEDVPIESIPGYLPWDKDAEMISCYQERKVQNYFIEKHYYS